MKDRQKQRSFIIQYAQLCSTATAVKIPNSDRTVKSNHCQNLLVSNGRKKKD